MVDQGGQRSATRLPDVLGGWSPAQVAAARAAISEYVEQLGDGPYEVGYRDAALRASAAVSALGVLPDAAANTDGRDVVTHSPALPVDSAVQLLPRLLEVALDAQRRSTAEPGSSSQLLGSRTAMVELYVFLRSGRLPAPVAVTEPALGLLNFGATVEDLQSTLDAGVKDLQSEGSQAD